MFLPYSYSHSEPDAWETIPAGSAAIEVGTALTVTGGKAAVASGTTKPLYIAMEHKTTDLGTGVIHVLRVRPETVFESELSVLSSSIEVGKAYTIDATGKLVTATDASGVATVVSFDGKAAGSKVRVRFL